MVKLRHEDTSLSSRPVKLIDSGKNLLMKNIENGCNCIDALSINSESSPPQATAVQSNRQRNPSVSSSCPSVNQELGIKAKG
jgi:hypothetical protein